MTIREKMRQLVGLTDLDDHDVAYRAVVEALGFDNVHDLLPADDDMIRKAYADDPHLNNIPLASWEQAAGFTTSFNQLRDTEEVHRTTQSEMRTLLQKNGIDHYSCAEGICILKTCAAMVAEQETETPKQHKVEVTLELICRRSFQLDLSDSDYKMLLEGDCAPLVEQGLFEETRAEADEEIDYTVYDLDLEKQVVDWR